MSFFVFPVAAVSDDVITSRRSADVKKSDESQEDGMSGVEKLDPRAEMEQFLTQSVNSRRGKVERARRRLAFGGGNANAVNVTVTFCQ